MTRQFRLSVLAILAVTILLTIKDCNHKRNALQAQVLFEKKEKSENITRDSFFKVNSPLIQSVEDNINICYSKLDNIKVTKYADVNDALLDMISYKLSDNKDSLTFLDGNWPYKASNTIALSFDPDNVSSFNLIDYMKQLKSKSETYRTSTSRFEILSNPGNYIDLTNQLKTCQYVAFIVKDKSLSPKIESGGYNSGAMHYKISIYDLQTRKFIETKEVLAINSDIEVRSEFELLIDLKENARKAIYKTIYRTKL